MTSPRSLTINCLEKLQPDQLNGCDVDSGYTTTASAVCNHDLWEVPAFVRPSRSSNSTALA